jgi:hypothetical protein
MSSKNKIKIKTPQHLRFKEKGQTFIHYSEDRQVHEGEKNLKVETS